MDTLDARIRYSIDSGEPDNWATYFAIDPNSGAVRQLLSVDTNIAKKFQLIIKVKFLFSLMIQGCVESTYFFYVPLFFRLHPSQKIQTPFCYIRSEKLNVSLKSLNAATVRIKHPVCSSVLMQTH